MDPARREESTGGFVASGFHGCRAVGSRISSEAVSTCVGWHASPRIPARRRCRFAMVISKEVTNSMAAEEEDPRRGRFSKTVHSELKRQVRYWYSLARTAENEGDLAAAEALYRKCVDLDEKDGHSWLALAQLHSRRDPEEARKAFAAALLKCPRNVHLLQAFGVFEHRMGNLDSARHLFHDALVIEPANPYVCQAWGLLEQRNGETDVARDIYRKCTERRPQSEVCAAWATLEFGDGDARKARELFKLGLRSVKRGLKGRVAYLNSWAEAEERSGNLAQARSLLWEALHGFPTAETRIKLAKLEARAGSLLKGLDLMKGVDSEAEQLSANAYNGWAFLEMQAANTGRTRELLKEGNAKFPMDGALLQTWGTLEEKCCEYETARELYSKSVEVRPTAVALVAWACMEAKLGDTARARELFKNALRVDPLHGAAYHAYASLEMKQGNIAEARRIFELGLDRDPSASVLVGYAQLEMKFGSRKDKARELFRRGVSQTRGDASFIWHAWLTMELRERDPLSARSIALEARKRYSGNSRILAASALAEAMSARGVPPDLEKSREFFKEAVLLDPFHAHAWQTWGVHEFRNGNEAIARGLFQKGLNNCPSHGPLWQACGVLEVEDGNFDEAEMMFRNGISKCPNHVPLYQAWACLEVRRGGFEKARELLEQALRSDPSHGAVWTAYGLLESKHGSLEKSRELFLQGLRRAPNHGPLYRTFAMVEERLGNYERARQLFREGIERDPYDAPSYRELSLLEKKFGRRDAFKELAHQAQDVFGSGNVKSVLLEGKCSNFVSAGDEHDLELTKLWSMEHALDLSS